jgi:uncharacterized membrane protein YqjE
MADSTRSGSRGLLDSLTILVSSLVAIAHTRLELLSTDLEEGQQHLMSLLIYAVAALFSLAVCVVLATTLVVVVFWDSHRLLVLGASTAFFLAVGVTCCGVALQRLRDRPKLFSASLSELIKDRQELISSR